MKKKNKQEKMIELMNNFSKLPEEKQLYVSGVIAGLSLQKDIQIRKEANA